MGKFLITAGVIMVIAGVLIHYWGRIPFFGKLPGDIVVDRPNFKFYFPLMTSIRLSVLLSLLLFLINKFRN